MRTTDRRSVRLAVGLGLATLGGAVGCLLPPTHVVGVQAPYYEKGPDQVEPPDGFLQRGTKVWVFGQKDSYSRLITEDLILGYVWSDVLMKPREFEAAEESRRKNLPRLSSPDGPVRGEARPAPSHAAEGRAKRQ